MNRDIEKYITINYYELLKISKRITKNHELSQELLHEVIMQLYDKDEIKLKAYDDNQIKYYIVSILRTNWYSQTSPFYYKIRKETKNHVSVDEIYNLADDEQLNFEKQQLFDILEESWAELDWFRKSLFEMYMTLGSMKKVSNQTRIPVSSISRYLRESKDQIKLNILIRTNE
jgi:hydroxymethylpyrimidine pyrophosphatase-like HAD family hydrolase